MGNPRADDFRHDNAIEVEKGKISIFCFTLFLLLLVARLAYDLHGTCPMYYYYR